ncbi:MAG: FtsX-like permease family protein, partial [Ktedonobacteraceae bacterium]
MKASLYLQYTSRSLVRGGQRTMLAVFCVAVGVMAVVGLQLVGFMLQSSLTSNVRETNGGDIALTAPGSPLKTSDLSFFAQLKSNGSIINYTSIISANGALNATASSAQSFGVEAVDPANYPLVSQPTFIAPGDGSITHLLANNQVIVTQHFLAKYQKHLGDTLIVYVKTNMGLGQTLHLKISGVIDNTGIFAQSGNLLLISAHDYLATAPTALAVYSLINITTVDQAHTDAAVKAINAQFPLAVTSTVADVLQNEQSSVNLITQFLEIAGLIALLIGGVGIVNTMQVMLSRRKTEIAMLKTAGYQRKDLYLLFGLEAGLLGLIGGIVGAAAAIGVSYLVRILLQNTGVNIPFILNTNIILTGIAIGCITALIFGLMPIVQAANVRPLHVIRECESKDVKSIILTIFLLIVLSVLFCAVAIAILNNNVMLGIVTTYSTLAFLLALSGFFGLVILAVSKLPVPEQFHLKQLLLILVGVAISALVYWVQPVFGLFLLAVSLLGVVVALLPRTWKVSTKMALRSLGRRRARTATTMLALFIGIFGIGLVVGVGQDLQNVITKTLAANEPYNIVAATSGQDSRTLQAQWNRIAGVSS